MAAPKGNEYYRLMNSPGRKKLFSDEKILSARIQEYFDFCKPHMEDRPCITWLVKEVRGKGKNKKEIIRPPKRGETPNYHEQGTEPYLTEERPITITGLAAWLDTNRQTLLNYSKRDAFFDTIQRAKDLIHQHAEESLWQAKITGGIIFNLKNNWTWKDESTVNTKPVETGLEDMSKEQLEQKKNELEKQLNIKKRS